MLPENFTRAEVQNLPFAIGKHEVGRIIGRNPEVVARLAKRGQIPGRLVGGRWIFSTKQIIELVEGC